MSLSNAAESQMLDNTSTLRHSLDTYETQITSHMAVYCFLSTIIVLVGIPANVLSLSYFVINQETKVSKMIFVWLNSIDLFVCCWMIPQAILNYSLGRMAFLKSVTYCSIRLAVYPTSLQLSIFVTQLLCLTRTYSLVRPLARIKKCFLRWCLLAFTAVIVGRVIFLFTNNNLYVTFLERRLRCAWTRPSIKDAAMFRVWNNILSLIMVVPTLFGCITSIALLGCSRNVRENPLNRIKRDANLTVIIITIVCLIGYIQFLGMTFTKNFAGGVSVFVDNISLIYACAAVSAINPIIYFLRIQRLREHAYWVIRTAIINLKNRIFSRKHRLVRRSFDRDSVSSNATHITRCRTIVLKMVDIRTGGVELRGPGYLTPSSPSSPESSPKYSQVPKDVSDDISDGGSTPSLDVLVTEHETHLR